MKINIIKDASCPKRGSLEGIQYFIICGMKLIQNK